MGMCLIRRVVTLKFWKKVTGQPTANSKNKKSLKVPA